jgi:hypothetical protein
MLLSDHKPLKMIFAPDKHIPTLATARIQRWALTLQNYNYEIRHIKGEDNIISDYLSRYVISEEKAPDME